MQGVILREAEDLRSRCIDAFTFLTMKSQVLDCAVGDHVLRIQCIDVGQPGASPTLVFLHDSLGCIATWRDLPAVLADRSQLNAIVFDRRGYGGSSPFPPASRTPRYLEE